MFPVHPISRERHLACVDPVRLGSMACFDDFCRLHLRDGSKLPFAINWYLVGRYSEGKYPSLHQLLPTKFVLCWKDYFYGGWQMTSSSWVSNYIISSVFIKLTSFHKTAFSFSPYSLLEYVDHYLFWSPHCPRFWSVSVSASCLLSSLRVSYTFSEHCLTFWHSKMIVPHLLLP